MSILDKGASLLKYLISSSDIISSNSNQILVIFNLILLSYVLWLLIKFRKTIYTLHTDSVFSAKNGFSFTAIGRGLLFYSAGIFIIRVFENILNKPAVKGESVAYNFGRDFGAALSDRIPLLVIAFFLLIVAQLIKEGYDLKQENDLTI
ncbi:DUF2975 domain-containing protein [Maribacter sp.]|uniref:DUF2975 domain-containing protein n=1 Tax=Maribacter sp. TaxID=1897614 RepID=UPI0032995B9C